MPCLSQRHCGRKQSNAKKRGEFARPTHALLIRQHGASRGADLQRPAVIESKKPARIESEPFKDLSAMVGHH
jgi:hypothetical protein